MDPGGSGKQPRHPNGFSIGRLPRMTKKDGKTFRDLDTILLSFANGQYESDLNLFGCACCRRIWSVLNDERLRRGVEVRELYERGLASGEKLADAKLNARI